MLSSAANERAKASQLDEVNRASLPLILLVEDHDDTRMMYRFVLEAGSYRVAEARNGEEAFKLVETLRPSLIVMDSNLPGMNGLMVTRYLREHEDGNPIPILFLSGDAHPQLRIAALDAGGDDYLVKPVDIEQFQAAIKRLLANQPNQSAIAEV
ncbi:MAG TPA: response regulator [Pyrinomonadaceae bacterium]|nr:response regulator [Pyrinomonadaceae bacterium]